MMKKVSALVLASLFCIQHAYSGVIEAEKNGIGEFIQVKLDEATGNITYEVCTYESVGIPCRPIGSIQKVEASQNGYDAEALQAAAANSLRYEKITKISVGGFLVVGAIAGTLLGGKKFLQTAKPQEWRVRIFDTDVSGLDGSTAGKKITALTTSGIVGAAAGTVIPFLTETANPRYHAKTAGLFSQEMASEDSKVYFKGKHIREIEAFLVEALEGEEIDVVIETDSIDTIDLEEGSEFDPTSDRDEFFDVDYEELEIIEIE